MKHIVFIVLTHISVLFAGAQGTFNIAEGTAVKQSGNVSLVLENMHLVNNGTLSHTRGNGIMVWSGDLDIALSGSGSTVLDRLLLLKQSDRQLRLQSNVQVVGSVQFTSGWLNLDNYTLDLGSTGVLNGENENSRAWTSGTGLLQASAVLNAPAGINPGNLGALLFSSSNLGNTTVKRTHKVQTNVSGTNSSIQRSYNILPTNNSALNATLILNYLNAELNGLNESGLGLWESTNNSTYTYSGFDSRNAVNNYVEKKSIASFSRYTLSTALEQCNGIDDNGNSQIDENCGPCGTVNSLYTTSITATSATLNWTASVNPLQWQVQYKSTAKGAKWVSVLASGSARSVIIATLLPGQFYQWQVRAKCGKNWTPYSGLITFKTLAASLTATYPQAGTVAEKSATEAGGLQVQALPNPTATYFTLIIKSRSEKAVNLRIVDAVGRAVESRTGVTSNSTHRIGQSYRPGVYFAQVLQGGKRVTVKLIKTSQ